MFIELAPGWTTEVERGPDCLFVRLYGPCNGDAEGAHLAERLWEMLQKEFARRLVLELDGLTILRSALVSELVRLHKRIAAQGGMLRVCGLSDECQGVLRTSRLEQRFPQYRNRTEAVMGGAPRKPR